MLWNLCFIVSSCGSYALLSAGTPALTSRPSITVIGDTTSPSTDLTVSTWDSEEIEFVLNLYANDETPLRTFPPCLFVEMIRINILRARAATCRGGAMADLTSEACEIINRVQTFAVLEWADSKASAKDDWALLGHLHQAAVALYCISSLQALSVLSSSLSLNLQRRMLAEYLQTLLERAVAVPKTKLFALWPLVVLGFEALHHGGLATRDFVRASLGDVGYYVGSYAPSAALCVLERFWISGEATWDSCFDQPYLFVAQTAVDVSGIS